MVTDYDIAIIGAGIVGLATARSLTIDHPALRVAVVEKEPAPGRHQSGRNSGVIHSGLYYRPDSLKARLCVSGAARLVDYCRVRGIDHTRNGKLVVATTRDQLGALAELERRGVANGLSGMRRVDAAEMRRIEPHSNGVAALHVPSTGAVDFGEVTGALAVRTPGRDGTLSAPPAVRGAWPGPSRPSHTPCARRAGPHPRPSPARAPSA